MLNSQALETAIGLVLMFFITALGASSIVEVWSRLMCKRSKDLERALGAMLAGKDAKKNDLTTALNTFKGTSIYESALAASEPRLLTFRKSAPSYLSAKSFADAVVEMLADGHEAIKDLDKVPGLAKRLKPIVAEAGTDLTAIKAALERWFDDTMDRLAGAYKRWATGWLLLVGLAIAIAANASTFTVAQRLWQDPVTRAAVATAASSTTSNQTKAADVSTVAAAANKLTEVGLPLGWDTTSKTRWRKHWEPWNEGLTNREIAARLVISSGTVRSHLEHAFEKLGVHTRTAALARAFGDTS